MMITKMEDNKTLFQKVSTELEKQLQEYKNQYPKNMAQIIRHNFGKIMVLIACAMLMMAMFSMSFTCMIFLFVGTPGLLTFALIVASANKDEYSEDNGSSLKQIESLKSQLQPLTAYPDVKKYSDNFDRKIEQVTAEKEAYKAKFKRYATIAGLVAVGIVVLEIVRIQISNETGATDEILQTSDQKYMDEVLDIDYNKPYFTLKPLQDGGKALDFSIIKPYSFYYVLTADGVKIADNGNTRHTYALIITDKDGKFAPLCPKFVFSNTDTQISSEKILFEPLRILLFLRDHQQELRYKIEKLK